MFIDFDIHHQMPPLQILYFVTLKFIFQIKMQMITKSFLQICLYL